MPPSPLNDGGGKVRALRRTLPTLSAITLMRALPDSSSNPIRRSAILRTVALFGALVLVGSVALAVSTPPAGNLPGPGNAPGQPQTTGDNANSRSAQIAALQKEINDLTARLQAMKVELKNLLATEPRKPGQDATDEQKKKYQIAHAQWQQNVDKVQHGIDNLSARLDQAKHKLEVLQAMH
jgi:hypothetical protein